MPVIQVHDLEINYTERGDGPTVIALHPATVNNAALNWIGQPLHNQGFNVVTPDQRGHGATANPAPDLHLDRLAADILEFIYQLGRSPVYGLGYSMGGAVMLYAALRQPDLFRSLVLIGTNYHAPDQARVERVAGPVEQRSALVKQVFDPELGISVGWNAQLKDFGAIACPVLFVCPDRDDFNDVEDNVSLYRTLPNAELLVVPACDHFDIVGHPLIIEAIRGFYNRVRRES